MTVFSYLHTLRGDLFDLTIPNHMLNICEQLSPESSVHFHLVQSIEFVNTGTTPTLIVNKLKDGSWNLTNKISKQDHRPEDKAQTVYIISKQIPTKNALLSSDDKEPRKRKRVSESQENLQSNVNPSVDDETQSSLPPNEDENMTNVAEHEHESQVDDQAGQDTSGTHMEYNNTEQFIDMLDGIAEDGGDNNDKTGCEQNDEDQPLDIQKMLESATEITEDNQDAALNESYDQVEQPADIENDEHDVPVKVVKPQIMKVKTELNSDEQQSEDVENIVQTKPIVVQPNRAFSKSRNIGDNEHIPCPICSNELKNNWNLWVHVKNHHKDSDLYSETLEKIKPLLTTQCNQCGKTFKHKKTLREHELTVHQEHQDIACPECGKKYRTKFHMNAHYKSFHVREPRSYLCQHCPAKFNTRNVLREHIKYVHTEFKETFKCQYCDFTYHFHSQYYNHVSRVHGEKKHTCNNCGYKCATAWYMRKHSATCIKRKQRVPRTHAKTNVYKLSSNDGVVESTFPMEIKEEATIASGSVDQLDDSMNTQYIELHSADPQALQTVLSDSEQLMALVNTTQTPENPCSNWLTVDGPDGTQQTIHLIIK